MARKKWSQERIIAAIRERWARQLPLECAWKEDKQLYDAAKSYFGGWWKAIEAAGIPTTKRSWSKEEVLEAIRSQQPGVKSKALVRREEPGLYRAAQRHFGNWRKAAEATGLLETRQPWSKARVIEKIREWHKNGTPPTSIWRKDRSLRTNGFRLFGSWHNAIAAAGFESRPWRRWSKQRVLEAIRARHRRGLPMTNVRDDDSGLGYAAVRYVGNWNDALVAAGLSPNKKWTKTRVLEALQAWRDQGRNMHRVWQENRSLYCIGRKYFGTWHGALLAVGLKSIPRRKWSKKHVIEAIRDRHRRGLKMTNVCREDVNLGNAARKYFGSWRRAVLAAGLPPGPRRAWSAQRVIEALRAWQREHRTTKDVWKGDHGLYATTKRFFGSFRQAMEAAGLQSHRKSWTDRRVIDAIRAALARGGPPTAIWRDNSLSCAARVYFGSRSKALAAAGVETPPPRRWTQQMVIDAIRVRHRQGARMTRVDKEDRGLYQAARRQFGGWGNAMETAGLTTAQKKWSKQRIVLELQAWYRLPESTRGKPDRLLYAAASRYFSSARNARIAAGLDPAPRKWSKQRVMDAIQDRYVKGQSLQSIRCENTRLLSAAKRLFGSWRSALAAAGLRCDVDHADRERKVQA